MKTKTKKLLSVISMLLCILMLGACTPKDTADTQTNAPADKNAPVGATVKIATLNGPTTVGALGLLKGDASEGSINTYTYDQIYASADAFAPQLLKGEIQAAIIPANAAATIAKNSGGKIQIAAINNLGVLYILEKGNSINSIADLRGKTIVSTGAGTTPQYSLEYVLKKNGLTVGTDVTVEYKSEAQEVLAALKQGKADIAMLPQPAATNAQKAVEGLRIALDLNEEWTKVEKNAALVTGVLVVNTKFAAENPDAVKALLADYKKSCDMANDNVDKTAEYLCEFKIGNITNVEIAKTAIPKCNIKFVAGAEMKAAVGGYLAILFESDPASVGGTLPADSLYYIAE